MNQQSAIIQSASLAQWSSAVESLPDAREAPIAKRVTGTSTLPVVTEILRSTAVSMTVRQIVEAAGAELPTRSKTPCTVVARDLAMDIKRKGEASAYVRTGPGRFTLRGLAKQSS